MIEPLHIATIGKHQLRFFRTPINDGRPDLPWIAVEDLHCCLGLNRAARKHFLHRLREWKEPKPRTVATAGGIITIVPHFMAQGMVDGMVDGDMAPERIRAQYDDASSQALRKLIPGPSQAGADPTAWLLRIKAAMNRWEQSEAPK
jgi:hypothetical protein